MLRFTRWARRGEARLGWLDVRGRRTPTPAFMPVGTRGVVKAVRGSFLTRIGYRAALANTYHLHLRPGEETVRALGGLHRWMDFNGIILTDSGGYQVYSLSEHRKLDDDGVTFRSHLDGNEVRLTPERAMEIQHALDSDIAMVLDECPPADASPDVLRAAVDRSLVWAERSLHRHRALSPDRATFAISQGGRDAGLRQSMARELTRMPFDGFALGGISVGETAETIREEAAQFTGLLPPDRPRYLMGVATPRELVEAVLGGIDLFDCVLPTRNARNGHLFTRFGIHRAKHAAHAEDPRPVEPGCPCDLCTRYPRAVLRHLFQAGEMLGPILATEHNLVFFARLLADLRGWIQHGDARHLEWLDQYGVQGLS